MRKVMTGAGLFLLLAATAFADRRIDVVSLGPLMPGSVMERIRFGVGDYRRGIFLFGHGPSIGTRYPNWHYEIQGAGHDGVFPAEKLSLSGQGLLLIPLAGGTVKVDRKANLVTIALKVLKDGKIEDFQGNGTYKLGKIRP